METQRHALVKRDYLVPFVLVTSLFFLWGFAHAILDVLNKHFQEVMDITRTHSAMVQVMFYLGYFVMAVPAGLFITRYGYRRGVVFGLLLYGIGSLMFIPGEYWMSFEFFLFSLFVIACGLVFLETAANPYMTELGDRETAASRLNLAQSFNGLGCICGPLVGGLLLFSEKGEANISYPYMLMGVVVLIVALVFSRIKLPEIVQTDSIVTGEKVCKKDWDNSNQLVLDSEYNYKSINKFLFFLKQEVEKFFETAPHSQLTEKNVKEHILAFVATRNANTDIKIVCEPENEYNKKNKITFVDLFAGAGGFSEGFLQAEHGNSIYEFLLGSDINENCELTHLARYNYQLGLPAKFHRQDITENDFLENLLKKIKYKSTSALVLNLYLIVGNYL